MAVENNPASASTRGPQTATNGVTVRTLSVMTDTYVASDELVCMGWDYATILFDYQNGDETLVVMRPEGFDGTTWRGLTFKADQSSGKSAVSPDIISLSKAVYNAEDGNGATGYYTTPQINCRGFQKIRVLVKATGTNPTSGKLALALALGRSHR